MGKKKKKKNAVLPGIDWRNHLIELFVVLLGILIAFQLNTCASQQKQRQNIRTHFGYILAETESNRIQLLDAIQHTQLQLKLVDSLADAISQKKNPFLVHQLSFKLLNLQGADIRQHAFQTLAQSGDIRFIEDYSVKNRIIVLYENYDLVEDTDQIALDLYNQHFYPYLKNHFDLANWKPQPDSVYFSLEYANVISTYYYLLGSKIRSYQGCLDVVESYLAVSKTED